jgi:hypothetical protein
MGNEIKIEELSKEITDTYSVVNNSFVQVVKDDNLDRVQLEVGDTKQQDFYPQLKLLRWDNEVNFSARLVMDEQKTSVITDEDKIIYQGENISARFYNYISEKYTDGAYEFDIVLKERPKVNNIIFTIETKGLLFFKQFELSEEEIKQGSVRPDNIINSYAVYYENQFLNRTGCKIYGNGKAFHIYRPEIIDSNGNRDWCDINIIKSTGLMSIDIPSEFLDKASYPVTVDPTFGFKTVGGSHDTSTTNLCTGSYFRTIDYSQVQSLTMYVYPDTTHNIYAGIFKVSDLSYIAGTNEGPSGISANWYTMNLTTNPVLDVSTDYYLLINRDTASCYFYYDTTDGNSYYKSITYNSPILWNVTSPTTGTKNYSIYCTYNSMAPELNASNLNCYNTKIIKS